MEMNKQLYKYGSKEHRIESTMITYEMTPRVQMRGNEGLNLCSVSKDGGKVFNIRGFVEVKSEEISDVHVSDHGYWKEH